jgi:hypothetical protein
MTDRDRRDAGERSARECDRAATPRECDERAGSDQRDREHAEPRDVGPR